MWTIGAGDRIRTYDLRITNALLYQLSYTGVGTLFQPSNYIACADIPSNAQ